MDPLTGGETRLTGGVLLDRYTRNVDGLFRRIDAAALAQVYAETHEPGYAEPEFAGKYIDTAVALYRTGRQRALLDGAAVVVRSIVRHQRDDGYLGTYRPELTFDDTFSVWNQAFTIMGLLSFHEATADPDAMHAARKCADFIVTHYMPPGRANLLHAGNQGVEHSCILDQMVRLYQLTGHEKYLAFCWYIVRRWEGSNLRFLSARTYFQVGCIKAAESLICCQGLVRLYRATGDAELLAGVRRYVESVASSQIGPTGNGSIAENWSMLSPRLLSLGNEAHPNENCVAVCWMKLCQALLEATGDGVYGDRFEQTLYNHLLGSQALDGSDFSYYQALVGRKVHRTTPGAYSCCRYRGMNLLAHLPEYVVLAAPDGPVVHLYTPSVTRLPCAGQTVQLEQRTAYPRDGEVELHVRPERDAEFTLRLRIPGCCERATVRVGDQTTPAGAGFAELKRRWPRGGTVVKLSLDLSVRVLRDANTERPPAVAVVRGPLVLAIDSRYGTPLDRTCLDVRDGQVTLTPPAGGEDAVLPIVRLTAPGRIDGAPAAVTLVDYASAGSVDPKADRFSVPVTVCGAD